jgi:isopentenyl phosphate kinase
LSLNEPIVILKLGGSVITKKNIPETPNHDSINIAAEIISNFAPKNLIIVHGGGSFGHHFASEHGVTVTKGTHSSAKAAQIHSSMIRLCEIVNSALNSAGLSTVPIHPLSVAWKDIDSVLHFPHQHISSALGEGFIPVIHGDLILNVGLGVTVISGDEIVRNLSNSLPATRIGFCTSTPGVLDSSGNIISNLSSSASLEELPLDPNLIDVTGGMSGKIKQLEGITTPVSIFNLDMLEEFLKGNNPGTTVY